MRRAFIALSAITAVTLPLTAAGAAVTAPAHPYAPPSAAEVQDTRHEFLEDSLHTLGDRSGDIFFLPKKYNFISGVGPDKVNTGHVKIDGTVREITGVGISHGAPWDYDRQLPLVWWGPAFIKPGQKLTVRTSQQDVAPTIAQLIGGPRPSDAYGRVLTEALLPTQRKPKVVLTMLFDQGGEHYYSVHPGATPFIDKLKREGTYFANTRVSHVDMETAMGHVAIGTGAFPAQHGLPSNEFWHGGRGKDFYCMEGPEGSSVPTFMMSPTLGDWWLHATQNKALLFSYCWADRAAIGMGGHGSFFAGNKQPWVYWFDQKTGKLTNNASYYELPGYLKDLTTDATVEGLFGAERMWMGHAIKKPRDVVSTPAMARFDGEHIRRVIDHEAFGQDDVPDLIYTTLKSTDMAGHIFGQESEESGAVLAEQDHQFELIVDALVKKVGAENVVVALCADHGGPPLPELSGGKRLRDADFVDILNKQFDKTNDGFPLVEYVSATQIWVDKNQMAMSGTSLEAIKRFVETYRVDGKPYFDTAYTRYELEAIKVSRRAKK
jgi:hypothetical protein